MMKHIRFPILLLFALLPPLLFAEPPADKHYVSFSSPQELHDYLRWSPDKRPLISAHRGGPVSALERQAGAAGGLPENCLETFEHALTYAPCLIECDVRKSKDGELVLLHDDTLDRTTTGRGPVRKHTIKELKNLYLKDEEGNITTYRLPTLAEAFAWARGKAVLQLDIKGDLSPEEVTAAIIRNKAENFTVVITYNLETALHYHQLNPNLAISASAEGMEAARKLIESKIDKKILLGFVGVYEPPKEIYDLLHRHGVQAILGTIGNLDRKARKQGVDVYVNLLANGADVLATDHVALVAAAIEKFMKEKTKN